MKKKTYKIKKTKKLVKKLKSYWLVYGCIVDNYYEEIRKLEEKMEKETGIKGIEIFFCDGEAVGIGNADRSMELIHDDDLGGLK